MGLEAFGSSAERGARNVFDSAKKIVKTPLNVDWKKHGPVGGLMNSVTDTGLNVLGEGAKLSGKVIGYGMRQTKEAIFGVLGWTGSMAKGALLNTPFLPMPRSPDGKASLTETLGVATPRGLEERMRRWRDESVKRQQQAAAESPPTTPA